MGQGSPRRGISARQVESRDQANAYLARRGYVAGYGEVGTDWGGRIGPICSVRARRRLLCLLEAVFLPDNPSGFASLGKNILVADELLCDFLLLVSAPLIQVKFECEKLPHLLTVAVTFGYGTSGPEAYQVVLSLHRKQIDLW